MTDAEAAVSVLVGLVCAYRRPESDSRAVYQHVNNLLPTAAPSMRRLGVNKTLVTNLLKQVAAGKASDDSGMPTRKYAADLLALRRQMRSQVAAFCVRPDVPERLAGLMRATVSMLTPDTGTVERRDATLNQKLVALPDRTMRVLFDPPANHDQAKSLREASVLVKRMVGESKPRLDPTQTKEAKERHPETYKRYLKVRADVAAAYKNYVRSAARAQGGPVAVTKAISGMKSSGISYHPYHGLQGLFLGEDGKLYTSKPHRLITKMPAPGSEIVMNPAYDPKTDETYVFKFRVPGTKRAPGEMTEAYTITCVRRNKSERFNKVSTAIAKMPSLRPRWVRDLKSGDPRTRMLAAMTETLYSQAARIGGKGNNVDGKTTYGISTLLVGHVQMRNGSAIITYPGKDLIQQRHVLNASDPEFPETKLVLQVLQQAIRGKRASDFVWTDPRGERVTSADVNAYMRGKKLGISPHKFRHVRGSVLMQRELDALRVPKGSSQQQIEKLVKNAAVNVGSLLGHMSKDKVTPATAIRSYIHPGILADFFQKRGLRVPQWVPVAGRGKETEED